jgi:ankyrin repeat protein
LLYAAFSGQLEIASILLEHGAGLDDKDANGMSPLHLAACSSKDSLSLVKLLVPMSANCLLGNLKMDRIS